MFGDPTSIGLIPKDEVIGSGTLSMDSAIENTDLTMSLQEEGADVEQQNLEYSPVVDYVMQRFYRAEENRYQDELRWLECYRNYRGEYGPETQFLDTEKSKAFVKITKTKVLAAYAQILDVLLAKNRFPIAVEATKEPLGIEETIHYDPKSPSGQAKDGSPEQTKQSALSGVRDTRREEIKNIGKQLEKELESITENIKSGPGVTPTSYTWHPAEQAAKKLDKLIQDQLEEAEATKSLRHTIFEMPLFGQGVFKGPFLTTKEYPKWSEDGEYSPMFEDIPDVGHTSIWNFYPDPDAKNVNEAEYVIERHRMTKTQIRKLKRRPYFRAESIDEAIAGGPNYTQKFWEHTLKDDENSNQTSRYEVLEYWGMIDRDIAESWGEDFEIPEEYDDFDEVQVNIWVCNHKILRFVMNPFTPARIPYYSIPYELNPYSFFGIGVAENMFDTQLIMNGFMRLAVDNAALSGNIIFEVDEGMLAPGQDMKLYPGKTFVRQSGPPGQSIFSHKIQNVTQECLMMFDKARQLSDESTGMPSYAHGQTGIQGTGRTASGMSMLMGAAALNIKAVVKNIDDYLLMPLGNALFAFNMQFNFDKDFVGDLAIAAKGTDSLMRNEIRSQKLMQFLQIAGNPMYAPFVKIDYILREIADSLDLDNKKVVNDPRMAAVQAQTLGQMGQVQAPAEAAGAPQQPGRGGNGPPPVSDPTQTGNGNIAPGAAPVPGEQGNTVPQ